MGQVFRKFKAETFDEAYQLMIRELGSDAVVINTKEVTEGGIMGMMGRKRIELTASVPSRTVHRSTGANKTGGGQERRRSLAEKRYEAQELGVGSEENVQDTVAYFKQLVSDAQNRIAAKDSKAPVTPVPTEPPVSTVASAPVSIPAPPSAIPEPPISPMPASSAVEMPIDGLQREVYEMRQILQVLVAENPGSGFSADFIPHYRMLVDAGVSRTIAADLINRVTQGSDLGVIRNERIFRERLKLEIQKRVRVTGGLPFREGQRRTVALVGATGVGKTTNLAKLAAMYAVREGAQVALITTDTYRVAAPEQLHVYANIIGLPMKIANNAKELASALNQFADRDVVLIDTAGGSQFNALHVRELQATLEAGHLDDVILVLTANTRLEELHSAVLNFSCLRPGSILFSKLDETRHFGGMLTIAAETNLPISYFSTGQNVPDDIELASAGKIAKLIVSNGGSWFGSGS